MVDEGLWRVERDDVPVVDHGDAVAKDLGFFHVMGREHDRHAVGTQTIDEVPHVATCLRVESGRGFVEEHCDGSVYQSNRYRESLFLSAGEVSVLGLGAVGEFDFFKGFFCGHVGAVQGGKEVDRLLEVQVVEKGVLLELDSDHPFDASGLFSHIEAADKGIAAVQVAQPF